MALADIKDITIKQDISCPSKSDNKIDQVMFADNIEHLEALKYISRLKLARAYLLKFNLTHQPHEFCPKPEKVKDIHMLGLFSKEELSLDDIEDHLYRIEISTRQKIKKSLELGIKLYFEEFCRAYDLDTFERNVLALLFANSTDNAFSEFYKRSKFNSREIDDRGMTIGAILSIIHNDYREQITSRKYFSIDQPLIRQDIVIAKSYYRQAFLNLLDRPAYLHDRVVRYLVGDNNVYDTDLQCLSRDRTRIRLDQVIIPDKIKKDVLKLANNYSSERLKEPKIFMNEFFGYGTGLIFLFYGPSGSGKTMMAHAIATTLNKELLCVNMQHALDMFVDSNDLIKNIFKEAKLSNGIVFFDECDETFQTDSSNIRNLLIEIEKADCIVIMATNTVFDLDPALDRRITMKVPFSFPDTKLREKIWKALMPPHVSTGKDVDFRELAEKYLFTGGLIKNTIFTAITNTISKNGCSNVVLNADEINEAAEWQSASMFDFYSLGRTYAPQISIEEISLRSEDKTKLINVAKACSHFSDQFSYLRLLIGCSDISTGINIAEAVAGKCGLKVREFQLPDLVMGTDSANKFKDPMTGREMNPLEYALRQVPGHRTLNLLVDHESLFEQILLKKQQDRVKEKDILEFYRKFRKSKGIVFLVTTPIKTPTLPVEFSHYFEVHPPSEEIQLKKWEEYLGEIKIEQDMLVDLVEQYPIHLNEIFQIVQEAKKAAFIKGNMRITFEDIRDVLKRIKNLKTVPVLFGNKNFNSSDKLREKFL